MEKGCNELSSSYLCEQVAVKEKSRVPEIISTNSRLRLTEADVDEALEKINKMAESCPSERIGTN